MILSSLESICCIIFGIIARTNIEKMNNSFEQLYNKLNSEQKRAVEQIDGPVLMLAGPGSGKTQVIAMRIANIIRQTDTPPDAILALTFTEKAATNMRSRLVQIIGTDSYKINIATFHSFCNELINHYPEEFAFARELKQLDDLTRIQILESIIDTLELKKIKPYHSPYMYLANIKSAISTLKKEGLTATEFKDIVSGHQSNFDANHEINPKTGKLKNKWKDYEEQILKNTELASIYELYSEELRSRGLYDFEDMIMLVTKKLKEDEDFKLRIQESCLYVLVDEYQDTNGAQNRLLMELTDYDSTPNLFVVGDEDQAIFSFQGANIRNILEFKNKFPETVIITTIINYRSRQGILTAAQQLISHNPERFDQYFPEISKKLMAAAPDSQSTPPITQVVVQNNLQEAQYVVNTIKDLLKSHVEPGEIAVIYRNHADAQELIKLLQVENIPFTSDSTASVLENITVQKVTSMFSFLNDPTNSTELVKILHYDSWGIDQIDLFKALHAFGHRSRRLSNRGIEADQSEVLLEYLLDANRLLIAGVQDVESLQRLSNSLLQLRQNAFNQGITNLFQEILETTGLLKQALEQQDFNTITALHSLQSFIENRNANSTHYGLSDVVSDINSLKHNHLSLNTISEAMYVEGVHLLTAHKAKGLEYKHVFIIKAIDKHWGNKRSADKLQLINLHEKDFLDKTVSREATNNEELRLFFVALTRAKEQVYISYAENYFDPRELKSRKALATEFLQFIDAKAMLQIDLSDEETALAPMLMRVGNPKSTKTSMTYSSATKKFLQSCLEKVSLSATGLNDYLECPERYLYLHVLQAPEIKSLPMTLGRAVHHGLEAFAKNTLNNIQLPLPKLLTVINEYINEQNLLSEESESLISEAEKIMTAFYPELVARTASIKMAEYSFKGNLKLDNIPLKGRIDLVEASDKANGLVNLIDYKNKPPQSRNALEGVNSDNPSSKNYYRQLSFYALLSQLDKNFPYTVDQVGVAFLKPTKAGKFKREYFSVNNEDIDELKRLIHETWGKINNLEFSGRCQREDCITCHLLT